MSGTRLLGLIEDGMSSSAPQKPASTILPMARPVPPAPSSSERETLDVLVASLSGLSVDQLRLQWRNHLGGIAPAHLPGWLIMRVLS